MKKHLINNHLIIYERTTFRLKFIYFDDCSDSINEFFEFPLFHSSEILEKVRMIISTNSFNK